MNLDISVADKDWKSVPHLRKLARQAVRAVVDDDDVTVSILFTGDAEILELNQQWRGKATPTNILSFPLPKGTPVLPGEERPLGDIVMAYGTVAREAGEQRKPVTNHITHLIIHAVLHLLGYDHNNDAEAHIMEARETETLARLGIEDPYRS